ncbi:Uncharacterized protein TCM_038449 [Theobroma cacao]|uniref:Uncharacterized protein n=1 Tax=Theobroma cacao TaxID=3641 RepID=A0A061GQ39_THECC|nr:Uncharacterized protein TCM_038449 [Theobroma cacao]
MLADVCSLSYIIRIDLSFAVWPRLSRSKTGQEGQVLLPGYFHIQETWHLFNSCRDEMHSRTASFVEFWGCKGATSMDLGGQLKY